MIIKNKDLTFNVDGAINVKMIANCISEHLKEVPRLQKLKDYYDGKHAILNRQKSSDYVANNKAVFNYAKSIVDGIIGYAFGQPIVYNNIDPLLLEHLTLIDEDSHNIELATDMSIFGRAYELIYMDDELTDKPMPYMAVLSPLNTFIVYDSSIRKAPMFAVTYSANEDIDGEVMNYTILVYTDHSILTFITKDINDIKLQLIAEEEHLFGAVPILELSNNKQQQGDYEQILGLIDLYNILMNDRVSSKEQLVDSLLLIKNASLGDTDEEVAETVQWINSNRILELDSDGDARYLVNNMNEADVEVLKKAIVDDIHRFSHCPNVSDENFVGNSSGIN